MRVLIADDHPLVSEALTLRIRAATPNSIVDTAGSISEAQHLIATRAAYSVIILDLMLPDAQGFGGLVSLGRQAPTAPIVILSAKNDRKTIETAKALGARGYLCKTGGLAELSSSINRVLDGETVFPESSREASVDVTPIIDRVLTFTPAQLKVMLAVAEGQSNKQIAIGLGLSEATIKIHVSAGLRKLGVANRARALIMLQPLLAMSESDDLSATVSS